MRIYRPETDDGGKSAGSWYLPDAPPPSCLNRSSFSSSGKATQPNDATIQKGSGMSVPAPSDGGTPDTPRVSHVHTFSDFASQRGDKAVSPRQAVPVIALVAA